VIWACPSSTGFRTIEEEIKMAGIKLIKRPTAPRPLPPLDLRTPSGRPLPY
jgi:hypothetical protein